MKRILFAALAPLVFAGCATTGSYYAPPTVAVAPGAPIYVAPGAPVYGYGYGSGYGGWGRPSSSLYFSWGSSPAWRGGHYGGWNAWGPGYRPWGPPPRYGHWGPGFGPKPHFRGHGHGGFGRRW
jgi:hypothetical protein